MKKFFVFCSRSKLVLIFLLAIMPGLAISMFASWQYRNLGTQKIYQNLSILTKLTSFYYGEIIKESQGLLLSLSYIHEITDLADKKACDELLAKIIRQYPFYNNLIAVKNDGNVFCSGSPIEGQLNLAYRPYFQEVLKYHDFTVSDFLKGSVHGRSVLALSYPVLDKDEDLKLVLTAILDLSFLEQLDKEVPLPEGAVFFILDDEGVVLSSNFKDEKLTGQSAAQTSLYKELLSANNEGLGKAIGPDGRERLYAYNIIRNIPLRDKIFIAVGFQEDLIFGETNYLVKKHLAMIPLIVVATAFFFLLGLSFFLVHKPRFCFFWRRK